MALKGTGAVCIWNDITPQGREEFYDWHGNEHMPERAAIPGFLRSRRFIADGPETQPEFFTLYETADRGVLTSEAYLARLNAPTDWTRQATQAFRNTSRALVTVLASAGPGAGGVLATLRFAVRTGGEDAAIAALSTALGEASALPRCAAAHLCRTNESASATRTAESRERTDILAAPAWVLMTEACDIDAAREAIAVLMQAGQHFFSGETALGFYRCEFEC